MGNRNRWEPKEEFHIPFTPLLDIIFILIVFFLVSTTFYTKERDMEVKLPEGSQGTAISEENKIFVINVRQEGTLVVGEEVVTLDDLKKMLKELSKKNKRVEIRGDQEAHHGRIMRIMNLCKKYDISDYALTQRVVEKVD